MPRDLQANAKRNLILPGISIVIANWNGEVVLRQCLESIYQSNCLSDIEVIVVDNGSTDRSVEIINSNFPLVKLITLDKNMGVCVANNTGMKASRGKYVVLLNNDVMVSPNTFETMFRFLESNSQAGAVGCKIMNPDSTVQSVPFCFPRLTQVILKKVGLGRFFSKILNFQSHIDKERSNETLQVDWLSTCCFMLRREVLEKVGMQDERFFMFYEDTDWCKRIGESGWKLYYDPVSTAVHHHRVSTNILEHSEMLSGNYYPKTKFEGNRSMLLYFRKHHSFLGYLILKSIVVCRLLLKITWLAFINLFTHKEHSSGQLRSYANGLFRIVTEM